ncbi:putative Ig domain-containing protein, partial [Pedobacter metabolipauper]
MKKLLLLIFSLIALHTSAAIKYVNWNATGANNGTSWNDAYTVLQSALISAVAGDEIWVAKGTYHPTVRAGDGTRDQDKAFVLVPNVKIFGGFAGTETDLAGRNWTTNTTILSGDLDNSGTLTNADAAHVVISSGAVGSAELNGFTITGGNVYVPSDSRIVNGLQISTSYGGGIYSESSAPKLINLIVYGNKGAVGNGHGIFVSNSDLMISNTVISNNGESDSQWGGGIYVKNSNPTLTNVQVTGNTALYGGGIYSEFSNLTITNAVFSGNGRMNAIETYSGTATLTNVTISGSMYGIDISSNTQIKVFNSIIYNNAIGIYTGILGTLLVSHSLVQGMTATTNGNINGSTNPLFVNPINPSFNATSSGDYHLQSGSPIRDLGSNTYYAAGLTPDLSSIKTGLDGNDRMMGNAPEPGAYELPMITTISTSPLTYITQNKAVLGGNVTADNGTMVTERGIVISASNTRPTISDTKIISGSGMGAFSAIAAGLSAGTLYHTRAYAINTEGTAYGNIIDFTTAPPPPNISYAAPQVYTKGTAITDISPSNTGGAVPATIYGTVTQTFAGYNSPLGIGKDGLGNIYCADTYNNVLKKIAASNGAITTLATGFNAPLDAATDIFGNIYVSDFLNHQIKKISTADGSIAIVANMNEPRSLIVDELSDIYVTDGPIVRKISGVLTSTPFSSSAFLTSIDKDVNGNLFIAVFGAREIRKRDVNGIITTIASGFSEPTGLSLDPAGNLYVADRSNKNVKRISVHDGSISTVGPGFDSPQDVECDDLGNLYITELNQGQIKKMTITGYTISPELPAGLVFDGTTGKISGTPTSILASTDYKITAYNASGSNQTTLNITVNDIPPSNLSYSTPNTFTRGTTISDLTPSVDGGTVVSYSISPALTAGLNLNTTTGVIGGTPANFSAATDYTVTATNSKGSTTTVVNITVNEIAPSGLIYNTSKTYAPGVAITDLTPVNTGGTITNYSVSPNFPAGLSLNPTTGVISGTPASLTPTANYTISAANSIGTTTAVITITVRNPKTLFVKWDASGANNGDSWTDAFTDLQTALEAAIPNDELWVAKGTYKPAKKAGNGATDQHKTFVLLPNVKIFGGFAGTEPDLASRDWKANTTILSGDIDNSGTQTNGVDAFHVVVSVGDVGTAELNGFTVTGGNSTIFDYGNNPDYLINGYGIHTYAGGGIYSESSSPKLTNLIIDRNTTRDYGGGIYNSGSNPIITNTVISNNSLPSAHLGGGIYNIDSNPIITNVSITGNHASGGGGMVNRQSSPILTNVVLSGNDRCAMENYGGVITLTNVTISGNVYAAMMNWQGVLINIRNSIIYNNSSGIVNNDNSSLTNYYSLIQGLSDTNNGNIDGNADPLFVNPLVPATTSDGDYHLQPGSPLNNMGSNSFFDSGQTPELSAIIRDLDGNGRIAGAAIDLGAYEMLISADVTTSGLTALEGNNATIAGEVTSDSGNQVSERGIVLSSSNTIPMLSDTKVSSGSGTGFFYATASGLNPATLYYVRAYATNAAGTSYGSVISFMTRPPLPAIAYSAPQIYQKGTTVTAISPSNTGGTVPATVYGAVTETFTGFNNPNGAGKDGAGNMYIADTDNKLIKKISSIDGAITPASGNTKFPYDVAIDGNGDINMIISNNTQYDNRMVVRAYGLSEYIGGDTVLGATRLVTDALLDRYVANGRGLKRVTSGRGYPFYNGGKIISVEKDANGNFFMGDDATGEIQKMDINQAVTILGSGFSHPTGISADLSGNLYIADHGNSQVKKISVHDGTISIIGSGFDAPGDVECDDLGNLYVTEPGQNVVKKIAITGYTISPELPAGLAFDGKTGEISGTPTGISASADYTITAFNASGSNQTTLNITVNDVAPSSLSYQIPSAFQAGTAISDLTPTVSGGAVTAYSISPALPAGLNIDSQTGIISGTPSQFSPVLNYTVTAANSGGSITAVIRISVAVSSPVIAYNGPQTYTVNDAITSLSPVNTGGTIPSSPPTYTIGSDYGRLNDIALDAAGNMYLSIDGADYIPKIIKLSGTDGSLSTIATHTNQRFLGLALDASGNVYYAETSPGGLTSPIKRRTADGANTVTIASGFNHIQSLVVDAAGNIYFADRGNNAIGKIDVSTSQVTYFGPPLEFSHPFGVALDVAGNIYVSDTDHRAVKKISAIDGSITTIATGFTPIDLTIDATGNVYVAAEQGPVRRIDAANGSISTLAYSNFLTGLTVDPSGALYGVDNTDAIVSKLFRTGYFVSPALPAGLTIDNNTGIISGTPTAPTELNMYTITGFNESGSHSTSLDIAVIDVAPSELDYTTPNVFTKGTAITSLSPTVSGGAVTSYSISPALPTGLSFSTTTGVISGTPTVLKTATDYTVTATNTGGNTTASLNITVNDVTPSALSYTTPNVFTKGTAITSLSPTISGGAVTSYSISPA